MPFIRYTEAQEPAPISRTAANGIRLHAKAEDMPNLPAARFARMPGTEDLYALVCDFPSDGNPGRVMVSRDKGITWESTAPIGPASDVIPSDSGAFAVTRNGILVAAFANYAGMQRPREWDPAFQGDLGWREPTCVARSLDGGKTWQDLQQLHSDWTGAVRDMIETRDGHVVFSTMKLRHTPGRHTVLTYRSTDEGATWQASNLIDLGGVGHHGGLSEPTLLELRDGRLLQFIRTNWGQFWRAFSDDGGLTWHPHGPAGVDASSAPGCLLRLSSGRIVLVWNREYPEGRRTHPLRGGDGVWSATPVSNFRQELSISFSEDECENWSSPVVIARNPEGEISYPYLFEPEPGLLWVTACRLKDPLLRIQIRESDFVRETQACPKR